MTSSDYIALAAHMVAGLSLLLSYKTYKKNESNNISIEKAKLRDRLISYNMKIFEAIRNNDICKSNLQDILNNLDLYETSEKVKEISEGHLESIINIGNKLDEFRSNNTDRLDIDFNNYNVDNQAVLI